MEKEKENQHQEKITEINKTISEINTVAENIFVNTRLPFVNEKQLEIMEESQKSFNILLQSIGISEDEAPIDTITDTLDRVNNSLKEVRNKAIITHECFILTLRASISKAFANLSKEFNVPQEKLEEAIDTLAEAGWVFPMRFTPGSILELVDKNTKEQLDEYFYNFYTQNNNKKLSEICIEIMENQNVTKWQRLMDECIKAYETDYCVIIIPCLISILEGLLSKISKDPNNIHMKSLCQKHVENEDGYTKALWISIWRFIEKIYTKQAFDKKRPALINRHWILHGRDETNWKSTDVVRLFIAIHTLLCVLPDPKVE